jgi:hypothetical protein
MLLPFRLTVMFAALVSMSTTHQPAAGIVAGSVKAALAVSTSR